MHWVSQETAHHLDQQVGHFPMPLGLNIIQEITKSAGTFSSFSALRIFKKRVDDFLGNVQVQSKSDTSDKICYFQQREFN